VEMIGQDDQGIDSKEVFDPNPLQRFPQGM
jgi:hypothetical protein